jgi:hypothetical protein
VTLGGRHPGLFTLRGLTTPATYTVVASKGGYTTQTLTLSLSTAQSLKGVVITLSRSKGSIAGTVAVPHGYSPAGIAVQATDGKSTVQTRTAGDGSWRLDSVPVPGTYTLTFSRTDLATSTVAVTLNDAGRVSGAVGPRGVAVAMQAATGTVAGTVEQYQPDPATGSQSQVTRPVSGASVSLISGATTYTVATSGADGQRGQFEIDNVPPGTYTLSVLAGSGTGAWSTTTTVTTGTVNKVPVLLQMAAQAQVVVTDGPQVDTTGWSVFLYPVANYPSGTFVRRTLTSATTGADALFENVDAGQYVVALGPTRDPATAVLTRRITVLPSQRTTEAITVTTKVLR